MATRRKLKLLGSLVFVDGNYVFDERYASQIGGEYGQTIDDDGRLIEAKLLALTTRQAIRIANLLHKHEENTLVLGDQFWHHPSIIPFLLALTLSFASLVRNQMYYILFDFSLITNTVWGVLSLTSHTAKSQASFSNWGALMSHECMRHGLFKSDNELYTWFKRTFY